MRVKVQFYRTAPIRSDDIRRVVGLPSGRPKEIESGLKEKFGPLAPRIRLFWNSVPDEGQPSCDPTIAYVGIEVETFDLTAPGLPISGLIHLDPMIPEEMHKADGALESELARWGLYRESKYFELRGVVEATEDR